MQQNGSLGKYADGFTLIELLIAMAVIAILAAIAYPSYQEHLKAGWRIDVQRQMMEQVNILERVYARNGVYPEVNAFTMPVNEHYQIGYASNGTGYTLTATPSFSDLLCGTMSLNQLGEKTAQSWSCWSNG